MNTPTVRWNSAIAVCWGAGVDSTAMLVEMVKRGIRPDIITFADVGAEKPETYEFIPIFTQYLVDNGFPAPTICVYKPQAETHAKYQAAVVALADRLKITLTDVQLQRLSRIFGNMVANASLPGIAFGRKSCSLKWKVEAQEPVRVRNTDLLRAWTTGQKVTKLIGFDATEDHRTFGDEGKGLSICNRKGLPKYADRYDVDYPLRLWGMDRAACCKVIADAGLPVPVKSACFFCPAMKQIEILQLQKSDPVLYALAIEMERIFRAGHNFRGDDQWNVKGKHKVTKEAQEWTVTATSPADARSQVRAILKDSSKPYQWTLDASTGVVGLGRSFSWENLAA